MLLAVDVGNTQTHLGAFKSGELGPDWRLTTRPNTTEDELAATVSDLLQLEGFGFEEIDGAIISSVVPHLVPEWRGLCKKHIDGTCLIVGP
jgi:type III pantothenate kinase